MPEYQLSIFRCKWCAKPLTGSGSGRKMRADKEFCGRSHRASYSNWRKRQWKLAKKICAELHEMGAYLDNRDTQEEAIQAFSSVLKGFRFETMNRGVDIKAVERG